MLTIGLTGNFGMGKTTVLKMFGILGAHIFDIDVFVHEILEKPGVIKKIRKALGNDIVRNGRDKPSIDKKRMADIIFNDPVRRKEAESIIHPEVLKMIKKTESEIMRKDPSSIVVFEVPLLFEAGCEHMFDRIVVVYSDRNSAVRRLLKKGLSKDEAARRMRAQMPITGKIKMADFVINNSTSLKATESRVKKIFRKTVSS